MSKWTGPEWLDGGPHEQAAVSPPLPVTVARRAPLWPTAAGRLGDGPVIVARAGRRIARAEVGLLLGIGVETNGLSFLIFKSPRTEDLLPHPAWPNAAAGKQENRQQNPQASSYHRPVLRAARKHGWHLLRQSSLGGAMLDKPAPCFDVSAGCSISSSTKSRA
jgi:hypothetical protein